jgi:hypothetical protein
MAGLITFAPFIHGAVRSLFSLATFLAFAFVLAPSAGAQSCGPGWLVDRDAPALSANVYALAEWDPDGSGPLPPILVAGGDFYSSAGMQHLAAWNGASWVAMDTGINGPVMSLIVDSTGGLVVGGSFTTVGSTSVHNIARWDGTSWSTLGTSQ